MRDDGTLRIEVGRAGPLTLIAVEGDVDEGSVRSMRAVFDQLSVDEQVLVDMAGVRFIDASGVNVLVSQKVWMRRGAGSFHICNPSTVVRQIVEISDFSSTFFVDPESPSQPCV